MKLVLFIHSLGPGGAERVAVTLAGRWAERGHRVVVVTLAARAEDRYELHPTVDRIALDLAAESAGLFDAALQNLRRAFAVRRILTRERPDIALAMMSTCNVLLALASVGMARITRIGSERTHPPQFPIGHVWEWLRGRTYRWLDATVALTSDAGEWIKTHTSARRVVVIPNPVAWPLPTHTPVLAPAGVGVVGRRRLLAVGRLGAEKRFDALIDTFAKLLPSFPDWELVIVGDGPERAALQHRINLLGVAAHVFLPGHAGNVSDWYRSASLFVLTSRYEGFPNALVEAMAHGVPPVSVDCDTGPRDIIRHEVDGLLVPPFEQPAIEGALRLLMDDANLRRALSVRAVEVRERFGLSQIEAMWDRLFSELAA